MKNSKYVENAKRVVTAELWLSGPGLADVRVSIAPMK